MGNIFHLYISLLLIWPYLIAFKTTYNFLIIFKFLLKYLHFFSYKSFQSSLEGLENLNNLWYTSIFICNHIYVWIYLYNIYKCPYIHINVSIHLSTSLIWIRITSSYETTYIYRDYLLHNKIKHVYSHNMCVYYFWS